MKLENEYKVVVPNMRFTPGDHLYFKQGFWDHYPESQKRLTATLRQLAITMPPHHYQVCMTLRSDGPGGDVTEDSAGQRYIDEHYVVGTVDQPAMMALSWVVSAEERAIAEVGLEFKSVLEVLQEISYFGEYNKGKFYDQARQQPSEIIAIKAGVTLAYLKEHATMAVKHSYSDGVHLGLSVWVKPNEDEQMMACMAIAVPAF